MTLYADRITDILLIFYVFIRYRCKFEKELEYFEIMFTVPLMNIDLIVQGALAPKVYYSLLYFKNWFPLTEQL